MVADVETVVSHTVEEEGVAVTRSSRHPTHIPKAIEAVEAARMSVVVVDLDEAVEFQPN